MLGGPSRKAAPQLQAGLIDTAGHPVAGSLDRERDAEISVVPQSEALPIFELRHYPNTSAMTGSLHTGYNSLSLSLSTP